MQGSDRSFGKSNDPGQNYLPARVRLKKLHFLAETKSDSPPSPLGSCDRRPRLARRESTHSDDLQPAICATYPVQVRLVGVEWSGTPWLGQ